LKLIFDEAFSNFAFNFNARRYSAAQRRRARAAAAEA